MLNFSSILGIVHFSTLKCENYQSSQQYSNMRDMCVSYIVGEGKNNS